MVSGCGTLFSVRQRVSGAKSIALENNFRKRSIKAGQFVLAAYSRINSKGRKLAVYIEGDGYAWRSRARLSENPTPKNPVALKLAARDPSDNVVYLARPCQYVTSEDNPGHDPAYWSDKRFSEEVINSMNQAIDILARETDAREIHLVGFSGGGAVAVLIAARREDVATLRTVAGNLDHEALSRHHNVTSLNGSLNPIDVAEIIKNIPQLHFVGSKDKIVPLFIAESFVSRMGKTGKDKIIIVRGCTHNSGWEEKWQELITYPIE